MENIKKPILLAGPCSAETREQVLAIAEKIKDLDLTYFRTGIWKPRTRPDAFEGVGKIGLEWLKEVQQTYGLKTTVEVATTQHVEEALKSGVDALWIGARTTVNPFSVQEIADALQGVDIPVLVKNPVNPDTKLWIGAVERIRKAGIKDIMAIHRGFSVYEVKKYRNEPQWQIPVDFMKEFPDMPIICDPSHIGGDRKYIQEISQKALDLNFDGLMIETHITPDTAWSDASQQVTPDQLKEILSKLIIRNSNPKGAPMGELEDLRLKMNRIDNELLEILKKRMQVSEKIGAYKKKNNMVIFQKDFYEDSLQKNVKNAVENYSLKGKFASDLYKLIHQESINIQEQVMNKQTE
jgi:chorismate mutase